MFHHGPTSAPAWERSTWRHKSTTQEWEFMNFQQPIKRFTNAWCTRCWTNKCKASSRCTSERISNVTSFLSAWMNCTSCAAVPEEWRDNNEWLRRESCNSCQGKSSGTDPCSSMSLSNDLSPTVRSQIMTAACRWYSKGASDTSAVSTTQKHLNSDTTHDYQMDRHLFLTWFNWFPICKLLINRFLTLHRSWLFQTRSKAFTSENRQKKTRKVLTRPTFKSFPNQLSPSNVIKRELAQWWSNCHAIEIPFPIPKRCEIKTSSVCCPFKN